MLVDIPGYGTQQFRWFPCANHEDYLAYIEKIIKYAVEYVKTDLIHFDNFILPSEPYSCHCEVCREKFRQYLKEKYPTDDKRKERFGFSSLDHIELPVFDWLNPPWELDFIKDPVFQEWVEFRCKTVSTAYARFSKYVKKLNPDVAVELNPNTRPGRNSAFMRGDWPPITYPYGEFYWTEEPNDAKVTGEGVLVSKIRTFKVGRATGNIVFTYTHRRPFNKILMAESMAYNPGTIGMVGVVPPSLNEDMRRYIDFYWRHYEYLRDTESAANVAVLRSYASLSYNSYWTHLSTMLLEQTLIQAKIPFDIIFDEGLKHLSKYSVLILPNVECLSDEQIRLIRQYVEQGGGLVATDDTSLYDQWRRIRPNYGLADLFGLELSKPSLWWREIKTMDGIKSRKVRRERRRELLQKLGVESCRNTYGKGRVVYVPEVTPTFEPEEEEGPLWNHRYKIIDNRCWHLPKNWKDLVEAVEWASGGIPLKVDAPLTVAVELLRQKQPDRLLLHLVNYNVKTPLNEVKVAVKIPEDKHVKTLTMLSPDIEKAENLEWKKEEEDTIFTVPRFEVYAIVMAEL